MAEVQRAGELDASGLVFALCHEIGNLIGAVRMHAHLLDDELGPRGLASLSLDLDDLSASSSALLGLFRPLLSPGRAAEDEVAPRSLLNSLEKLMHERGGRGAELSFRADPGLPVVTMEQDVLHHLLVSLLYSTLESAGPSSSLSLAAERSPDGVAFVIEDDVEPGEDPTRWREQMKRGRPLLLAVANELVGRRGGRVEVARANGLTRVELVLPAG